MKKNIIIATVLLGAIGLISFTLMNNKKDNEAKTAIVAEKNASVSVKTEIVKTEEVSLDFSVNGIFEPLQELTFSAEKSGKVIRVLVQEGDYVNIGQTLVVVRSDIINMNAQTAKASYDNAKADYARYENAYKTGGVTKQQLDQANLALTNAGANLKQATINVGDTRVKAPIKGFINKKYIEPGSILTGMPASAMFQIVNVSKLKLNVTANESQVASLKLGSAVTVTASVYPTAKFAGKITFIAPMADSSLNFPVDVEITNSPSNDLKAGMYGTAAFASQQQKESMMVVARNAFVGSVSSNKIFVVENGIAKLKNVTAGRIFGDKVEILDGLSDNEVVIVTGQINLTNGTKVDIIK
jgi:RND family efflux transporter MFP subunit